MVFSGWPAAAWGVSEPPFPVGGSTLLSGSQASALSSRTAWERIAAMHSSTWKCRKLFQVYLKNRSWGNGGRKTVLDGFSSNSGTTGVSTPSHTQGGRVAGQALFWENPSREPGLCSHRSGACGSVCCLPLRSLTRSTHPLCLSLYIHTLLT